MAKQIYTSFPAYLGSKIAETAHNEQNRGLLNRGLLHFCLTVQISRKVQVTSTFGNCGSKTFQAKMHFLLSNHNHIQ